MPTKTKASESEAPPTKSKKPLLIGAVVLVALAAAAVWFFVLRGEPAEAAAEPEPVAGEVLTVDPVSINLAEGRYLRLAFALQLTEETAEEPDPAHALDLAVREFSGLSVEELSDPARRLEVQEALTAKVEQAYPDEVMGVYYTEFVTQ